MRKMFYLISASILLISCGGGKDEIKEVKIGDQIWMTENLSVEKFNNGDPIPQSTSVDDWYKASYQNGEPRWCYYGYDKGKDEIYGKLYNWYAINDPRGLAPEGWRIPTKDDFQKLQEFVVSKYDEDDCLPLKSKDLWKEKFGNDGTNETGFNALPGGYINIDGSSENMLETANFWTCTQSENFDNMAYGFSLSYQFQTTSLSDAFKCYGYSVRCIKK
ncbi:MAG TPA: fibrobacter succinogenes major paralogous domain-containing protein [Bacteroidales bacterium]|nr:fibrobacter succinogenes major paralogous domain-containing protein [Bacteroidales bacterium]